MYTHRSTYLHTMCEAMTDVMGLSGADSTCGIVPMFHAMGWGLPYTATMLGAKQVMPHRFMTPDKLLDLMVSESVTISAGVPTIWQGVRALLEAEPERYDLSNLTRLCSGGSAPPISLIRWFWDHYRIELIQGWGMTETNPIGTDRRAASRSIPTASWTRRSGSRTSARPGFCAPGLEIEIVDEDFRPLPHDGKAIGEVLIRGPWVCSEYYRDPQPDKFHDGWLVTGDIAAIDEEQYLIIADRSKDLVKSGGEWISSVDLENHIVGPRRRRARRGGSAAAPEDGTNARWLSSSARPGRYGERGRRGAALRGAVREVAASRRRPVPRFPSPHQHRKDRQEGGPGRARGGEGYVLPELRTAPGAPGAPDRAGGLRLTPAVPIPGFLFLHRAASRLRTPSAMHGSDRPRAAGPEPPRRRRGRW